MSSLLVMYKSHIDGIITIISLTKTGTVLGNWETQNVQILRKYRLHLISLKHQCTFGNIGNINPFTLHINLQRNKMKLTQKKIHI